MADEVFNTADLTKAIANVIGRKFALDTSTLNRVKQICISSIEQNFIEGGRYTEVGPGQFTGGTTKWAPLKPATLARKKNKKTLIETSNMSRSFDGNIGQNSVSITNPVAYFPAQQFGVTFMHPGGTPYFIGEDGRAVFAKKGNANAWMRTTKPHQITIQARPSMVIQEEDFIAIADVVARAAARK